MPVMQDHSTNVLKFWRSVETFTLPDIPYAFQDTDNKRYTVLGPPVRLPWEPGELPAVPESKQWKHTLYFHTVLKGGVVDLLAKLTGSKEYREPVYGLTCLSALVLDGSGRPSERGYTPAGFIYGIKVIEDGMDFEELPGLLKEAQTSYLVRFGLDKEVRIADWKVLEKELDHLRRLTRKALPVQEGVVCISEVVAAGANADSPFLNSYYLHDLNTLIGSSGMGGPMETFLNAVVDTGSRRDLLDRRVLLEALHPAYLSAGRWPSSPDHGLYAGQQAALGLAMSGLRERSTLLGINGPPGTGKTTLLREVIADVVVGRAKRLLKGKVTELFSGGWKGIVDRTGCYTIDREVFGNDGVVVTSNNNTAIENISRELPLLGSIDRETFGEAEYFSEMAAFLGEEPSWGMMSAVLGRSENRAVFVNRFWFNKGKGFGKYLKEASLDVGVYKRSLAHYEETAGELQELLDEYAAFSALACAYHERLLSGGEDLEELASALFARYGIGAAELPGAGFTDLSFSQIHRMRPYSSRKINILRSRIFLRSLELHEWAIKVNARSFNCNLGAFVDMLSNKHMNFMDEGIAATLWNTFFFCIPVVSVTLASFQRQFPLMGQGSIGWLLLDEAGQATPAAACGAIWRSERAIIIGDTLQIPPVVTIPAGLGQLLQSVYGITEDCWNPLCHSAQFLADRVTAYGTYIGRPDTWTGMPLRAHRRCGEPMFSIANRIAYNGQMVSVRKEAVADVPTGESGWIDVATGTSLEGHVIAEEIQVVGDLLQQLVYFPGRVYIISPFRSVARVCRERFYEKGRVTCGTIHTFQGKEADIVVLVLGTMPGSIQARNWVAQSPNMLNVAVTRAKERLYVIGNRKVWSKHRYFDQLAGRLKVREGGRLF
ncbi:AAA domain-containing protein [Flavitalea sp. BT771]|uniref:DEAD/DEAH box helicase n=1 Tax=Flavitalea sp. BT771 TaxID=3063329 RepID=UPI0026E3943A|nr:AAA domain-containing protein [Flavitalea sp. BT771]MDO6432073.1 AAA domain-containing protein [Flavitalea sp. BT771]MDV6220982.1 AAA domain-containing protein [Flavitalea sp. BT771]